MIDLERCSALVLLTDGDACMLRVQSQSSIVAREQLIEPDPTLILPLRPSPGPHRHDVPEAVIEQVRERCKVGKNCAALHKRWQFYRPSQVYNVKFYHTSGTSNAPSVRKCIARSRSGNGNGDECTRTPVSPVPHVEWEREAMADFRSPRHLKEKKKELQQLRNWWTFPIFIKQHVAVHT